MLKTRQFRSKYPFWHRGSLPMQVVSTEGQHARWTNDSNDYFLWSRIFLEIRSRDSYPGNWSLVSKVKSFQVSEESGHVGGRGGSGDFHCPARHAARRRFRFRIPGRLVALDDRADFELFRVDGRSPRQGASESVARPTGHDFCQAPETRWNN